MRTVLISGAGVAGATLAYWLRRHGFTPTVVERTASPRARMGGHAVDLFGPAVDVAERMGVLPEIRDQRTRNDVISLVRPGRPNIDVPVGVVASSISDRHVEILRGSLTRILQEAANDDIEYVFGDSIRSITQDPGASEGVHVTFDHAPPRRFDLVVGADGLHSNVRRLVFGEASRFLHFVGGYLGVFSLPDVVGLDGRMLAYLTPRRLVTTYPIHQTDETRAVFVFRTDQPLRYDRHDDQQQRQLLRDQFATAGWRTGRILEHLADADDFYFDSITRVEMDSWVRGRVALVGDAGFSPGPAVGGGTTLAMVAAYVLAGELAAAGGDHGRGLAGYQREISGFARRSGRIARTMISQLVPANEPGLVAMRTAMRLFPRLPKGMLRWLVARQPGPADAVAALRMKHY